MFTTPTCTVPSLPGWCLPGCLSSPPALFCQQSPGTPSAAAGEPHASVASSSSEEGSSDAKNCAIFFARVPPLVPYEDLLALFSRYGEVKHLNLFCKWASAKTSKGCGTVQYAEAEEASTAMLALNGVHSFEGFPACEGPMVVEWMDASRLTSPEEAAGWFGFVQRRRQCGLWLGGGTALVGSGRLLFVWSTQHPVLDF